MTKAFVESHKQRMEEKNAALWRQGMYFYEALASITSALTADRKKGDKPHEYPSKPYPLFPKEQTMEEEQFAQEQEELLAEVYMLQMVEAGKKWGKGAK